MIDIVTNFIESKDRPKTRLPVARITPIVPPASEVRKGEQRTGFTRAFRWPVSAYQTPQPTTVFAANLSCRSGGRLDWEMVAIYVFVALSFAAFVIAGYVIWAKCGCSPPF